MSDSTNRNLLNWGLEFHDSEILGFGQIGPQFLLFISGCMHASIGRPGIDSGQGFVQAACFCFLDGKMEGVIQVWPADIFEGRLLSSSREEGAEFLELPFENEESVKVELLLSSGGEKLSITGSELSIQLLGAPEYVEEFEGDNSGGRGWRS